MSDELKSCGCKHFCESCGRDDIEVDNDGEEYCINCAGDLSDELCWPQPYASFGDKKADEWERQFMCEKHKNDHRRFCLEVYLDERNRREGETG